MIDVLGETWLTDPLKAIELVSGAILALAALTISVLAFRLNKQNSEQIRLNAVVNSNREALAWSQGAFNVLSRVTSLRLQPGSEITPEVFKASRRGCGPKSMRRYILAILSLIRWGLPRIKGSLRRLRGSQSCWTGAALKSHPHNAARLQ